MTTSMIASGQTLSCFMPIFANVRSDRACSSPYAVDLSNGWTRIRWDDAERFVGRIEVSERTDRNLRISNPFLNCPSLLIL